MSSTLVIDSSVIVKWLNTTDERDIEKADKILSDSLQGKTQLIAPELAKYEIGNVLLLKKKLTSDEFKITNHALYAYPIEFIPETEDLAIETYDLASKSGITYYDASFMSLAKLYNATLITENIKHQGKTNGINVKSLQDY